MYWNCIIDSTTVPGYSDQVLRHLSIYAIHWRIQGGRRRRPPPPNRINFFRFHICFCQKVYASEVGAPPPQRGILDPPLLLKCTVINLRLSESLIPRIAVGKSTTKNSQIFCLDSYWTINSQTPSCLISYSY